MLYNTDGKVSNSTGNCGVLKAGETIDVDYDKVDFDADDVWRDKLEEQPPHEMEWVEFLDRQTED